MPAIPACGGVREAEDQKLKFILVSIRSLRILGYIRPFLKVRRKEGEDKS